MSIFADHGVKQLFGLVAELEKRVKILEAQSHQKCSIDIDEVKIDKRTKEWRNSQTANSPQR